MADDVQNNDGTVISTRTAVKGGTIVTLITGATYTCPYSGSGGGAVDVTGGTVLGTDITFAGNTATCGGAIRLASGKAGVLAFDGNVIFVGNTATQQKGGAIYANEEGIKLLFAGGTFAGNAASQGSSGGAITCLANSVATGFTIRFSEDVIFDNNLVERKTSGGAIYLNPLSQLTFEKNVTFTGNTGSSGALYSSGKNGGRNTLVFSGDLIASNNASISISYPQSSPAQGAIYANFSDGTVSGNAIFTGNTCCGGSASGLVLQNSTFSFTGGTFADNVVVVSGTNSCHGGAIYASQSSALTFTEDVFFTGNTMASSNSSGGALTVNASTVSLKGGTFAGNVVSSDISAGYGGAIYLLCQGTLTFTDDIVFDNNTATNGGAIYNDGGTINFAGTINLATGSDTWVNATGDSTITTTVNWDITGGLTQYASIKNFERYSNSDEYVKQTITVTADQATGDYTIATGSLGSLAENVKTFTLTGGTSTQAIVTGGTTVSYGKRQYSLDNVNNEQLVLTVAKLSVADATITVSGEYTYNGAAQEAPVTVVLGGNTLTENDYTLSYTDNVNAGTATVTVTGKGDYIGTKDATFTIKAKELTVVGTAVDGKTYDGTTDATIGTLGTLTGVVGTDDVALDVASGTFADKDAGNGKDVAVNYTLSGDDADNYTVAGGTTTADIEKRDVTLTSVDATGKYDGTALTAGTVNESGSGFVEGEGADYTFSGSQTDAGSSVNTFTYVLKEGTLVQNYDIKKDEGTLTVTKRSVTLTSGSAEKVYDGTALTNGDVKVSGDSWATGEGATYTVTGSQTDIGTSKNAFTYKLDSNTQASNYTIKQEYGTLTVNKIATAEITITVDKLSKMYDGKALAATYSFTQGILKSGDELVVTLSTDSITDAGTSSVKVASYKVMRGETDVTKGYNFAASVAGSLEITKRSVTLTSGSAEKECDGVPLTCNKVTVSGDGWAKGEGATYDVTGSQTDIGTSKNTFTYTLKSNTKSGNYTIKQVYGTLTVTPSDPLIIKSGNSVTLSKDMSVSRCTVGTNAKLTLAKGVALEMTGIQRVLDGGQLQLGSGATLTASEIRLTGGTVINGGTVSAALLRVLDGNATIKGSVNGVEKVDLRKGATLSINRSVYEKFLDEAAFTSNSDGTLVVSASSRKLQTANIDELMAKKNLHNVDFQQDLEGIHDLTFTSTKDAVIGFQNGYGTDQSDMILFGNSTDIVLGSEDGEIDLKAGYNQLCVGIDADVEVSSALTNVSAVKSDAKSRVVVGSIDFADDYATELFALGESFKVGDVTGSVLQDSVVVGNESEFQGGKVILGDGNDNVKIGVLGTFAAEKLDLGKGYDTLVVDSYANVAVKGDFRGADQIVIANGAVKNETMLVVGGNLQMSSGANVLNIGSFAGAEVDGKVKFNDRNDSLLVGAGSMFNAEAVAFGAGNDVLVFGNSAQGKIYDLDFGAGYDTLTIGANSQLWLNGDYDGSLNIQIGAGSELHLAGTLYSDVTERFKNEIAAGVIEVSKWDKLA